MSSGCLRKLAKNTATNADKTIRDALLWWAHDPELKGAIAARIQTEIPECVTVQDGSVAEILILEFYMCISFFTPKVSVLLDHRKSWKTRQKMKTQQGAGHIGRASLADAKENSKNVAVAWRFQIKGTTKHFSFWKIIFFFSQASDVVINSKLLPNHTQSCLFKWGPSFCKHFLWALCYWGSQLLSSKQESLVFKHTVHECFHVQ